MSGALMDAMRRLSPRMRVISVCTNIAAAMLAVVILVTLRLLVTAKDDSIRSNEAYQSCQTAVESMQKASDYLTDEARLFVDSGERVHLDQYLNELQVNDNRGHALDVLKTEAMGDDVVERLEQARVASDELALVELHALHLAALSYGFTDLPAAIAADELTSQEEALTKPELRRKAWSLLYDGSYTSKKLQIRNNVYNCSTQLFQSLQKKLDSDAQTSASRLLAMRVSVIALLLLLLFESLSFRLLVLWPMSLYEKSILDDVPLTLGGARELRRLTESYNQMYAANHDRNESLSFEARTDALTGVLNRGAFNALLTEHRDSCGLALVDVDLFKSFNDTYGHDMGDAILIEVAATLFSQFRSTDHVCRIGGDEFAVIMVGSDPSMRDAIAHKLDCIADFLRDEANGLPAATLSVGVAFGVPGCSDDELLHRADGALYEAKRSGRDRYVFADDRKG